MTLAPYIAIRDVETYWEFWSERPLEEMVRLERQLRSLVGSSEIRWQAIQQNAGAGLPAIGNYAVGTDHNSPCLRVTLAAHTFLRIYAKTTSRLRFEVVHKKRTGQRLFQQSTSNDHADRGEAKLSAWLSEAALDAASRLNTLLGRMRQQASEASLLAQRHPHELIDAIYRALIDLPTPSSANTDRAQLRERERLRSLSNAKEIVDQLVFNGRIILGPNDPQHPTIMRLREQHILQRSGNEGTSHVYIVAPSYHSALEHLRAIPQA